MVLISVQSTETDNGYNFSNDFAEALVIEPNASVSLINVLFERADKFIVSIGTSRFSIKQGSASAVSEVVVLALGTYTGKSLADEISTKINTIGNVKGYYYTVTYKTNTDNNQFIIGCVYHNTAITAVVGTQSIANNPHTTVVMNTEMTFTAPNLICTGVTDRTSQYMASLEKLEVDYVPSRNNGGSFFEVTINTAIVAQAANNRAVVIGIWSNSLDQSKPIKSAVTDLSAPANLTWLDAGIVLKAKPSGDGFIGLDIYENGLNIGFDSVGSTDGYAFTPEANDVFRITIASDESHVLYSYKKASSALYFPLNVGQGGTTGHQTLDPIDLKGLTVRGIIGTDTPTVTRFGPISITEAGQHVHEDTHIVLLPTGDWAKMVGLSNTQYVLTAVDGATASVASDTPLNPDVTLAHHPILHLNVNNLPLHSIVGQKFKNDAVVGSVPEGSINGVTRLLAQFPRYHEQNGVSAVDKLGPFYYNYFPYSVRLANAHSINLNELQITVTNINGTLATDVVDCKLLLNITNEENVGGYGKESIGRPMLDSQSQVQSNVNKSQLLVRK